MRKLDFPAFRLEVQKLFRREVPVRERGEWEARLKEQRAAHDRLTGEIVARSTIRQWLSRRCVIRRRKAGGRK